jgi:hypothetical protein
MPNSGKCLSIRQAGELDITTVADLWTASAEWLGKQGFDQWQYPVRMDNIQRTTLAGSVWIVEDPTTGDAIGTITLDEDADPRLWIPSDAPEDALYLHRLVVSRLLSSRHIGSAVIDWACCRARLAGRHWLRLDAWTANTSLHRYYLEHSFRHVRTVQAPDIVSGALFERSTDTVLGLGPEIIEAR